MGRRHSQSLRVTLVPGGDPVREARAITRVASILAAAKPWPEGQPAPKDVPRPDDEGAAHAK